MTRTRYSPLTNSEAYAVAWVVSQALQRPDGVLALVAPARRMGEWMVKQVQLYALEMCSKAEWPTAGGHNCRLTWPNGTVAYVLNMRQVEAARGYLFDAAWGHRVQDGLFHSVWQDVCEHMTPDGKVVTTL